MPSHAARHTLELRYSSRGVWGNGASRAVGVPRSFAISAP
jgi:hypothetical protein